MSIYFVQVHTHIHILGKCINKLFLFTGYLYYLIKNITNCSKFRLNHTVTKALSIIQ